MAVAAPAIMMAMMAAGTAMTVMSDIRQGQAANANAKFKARQQEQAAAVATAAGHQELREKRRQTQILQSRALAAAGASGSGTLDSSVLNMIGGIAQQGEEDQQRTRFEFTDRANKATAGAAISRYEGKQALQSSQMSAAGSALKGMSSMMSSSGRGSSGGTGFGR